MDKHNSLSLPPVSISFLPLPPPPHPSPPQPSQTHTHWKNTMVVTIITHSAVEILFDSLKMKVKWLDLKGENDGLCLWTLSEPQRGTTDVEITDVEITVPLVKKPDLMFFLLKPRVGQIVWCLGLMHLGGFWWNGKWPTSVRPTLEWFQRHHCRNFWDRGVHLGGFWWNKRANISQTNIRMVSKASL